MDLERMKKINSMIPHLKKQGFAATATEAALQSDAMFRNQEGGESVIQQTAPMGDAGIQASEPVAQPEQAAPSASVVNPEVIAQLAALDERVAGLEGDVNMVIEKMNEMIQVITALEQGAASAPATEAPKEQQQTIVPKTEEKKEPHARSGNYTSNDVDITKIFYYGNK